MIYKRFVLAAVTCGNTGHPGVGRFEKRDGYLLLLGVSRQRPGSTIPPDDAARATTDGPAVAMAADYRGCPSCGADNIVRCDCGHLSCWNSAQPSFHCPGCGVAGVVSGVIAGVTPLASG
ncbi:hypothetical protein [Frankia sp. AgKG'84/4]|uniref:hypothetical protein n=1 Tax=Frankia sp. AgKG'84/4 TaxID=573490 RepID=UPI00200FC1DF|nr:hypothetical protein [Frankia sp. AgKG'84/4]MCL9796657.1 hypothetical protein [Frankia sp. AgKG'84/4]